MTNVSHKKNTPYKDSTGTKNFIKEFDNLSSINIK